MNPLASLELKVKSLSQFVQNQLIVSGLSDEARNAINHNVKLKVREICDKIRTMRSEQLIGDKFIFTVTTYRPGYNRSRVPGYFTNFGDAEKCVLENWGDIWEDGYYKFAIIEKTSPGLYTFEDRAEAWYTPKVDRLGEYERIEKPDRFKNSVCWGIG
jgi:hypothetical protein